MNLENPKQLVGGGGGPLSGNELGSGDWSLAVEIGALQCGSKSGD